MADSAWKVLQSGSCGHELIWSGCIICASVAHVCVVCLVGNNFCLPFSAPASLRLLPIHLFELQVSVVGNL